MPFLDARKQVERSSSGLSGEVVLSLCRQALIREVGQLLATRGGDTRDAGRQHMLELPEHCNHCHILLIVAPGPLHGLPKAWSADLRVRLKSQPTLAFRESPTFSVL